MRALLVLKSADEYDALTKARRFHRWRAGERDRIKRGFRRRQRRFAKAVILAALAALLQSGCVGVVDDYAKTALGMGENATGNTIRNLTAKHDLEAASYAAAYCGQPRIGAVERRYKDPVHLHARLVMCEIERELGFQP